MANDWALLQQQFLADNDKTGITAKEWCEQQGLNYQSARRYIKVRIAQKEAAHKSAQSKEVRKQKKIKREKVSSKTSVATSSSSTKKPNRLGRDNSGRFTVGNAGNPNPPTNAFEKGNQASRIHGGYAARFDDESLFNEASQMSLEFELELCRARALNCIDTMKQIRADMKDAAEVEQRIELYNAMVSTEQALDRNVVRIESITKTLSSIRIDDVNEDKIIADTSRIEAATSKLRLEADKLAKEGKGSTTPISEMISDLQAMGSDGLMSGFDD
ncbi:hypothetical protein EQ875_01652 [Photobacterium damselae subsp. damselae]|uniref:terminase n=1 Tax=Photobacterium damselae TaxID=38293 RepID=UPI00109B74B8|nr:terminase [Photobacterium damselae]TGZ35371.1 hypothetical protein EQ875_01652 [Photobacterium damselae subsp. damselae]